MTLKTRYIRLLLKFRHAFRGLAIAFKTQISFRIHIIVALATYTLGFILCITLTQWALVNSAILFVIVTEMFNTVAERICDFIQPKQDNRIKIIKDISAGAVLISVINALVIGGLVYIPRIISLF
jgi:diacylglycerol kinase